MKKEKEKNFKEKIKIESKVLVKTEKTYGKYAFKIPNLDNIKKAIGYDEISNELKNIILPLNKNYDQKSNKEFDYSQKISINHDHHTKLYRPVNIPKPSDWLYQHKELGQSYKNYSTGMINQPSKLHNTVFINILDENPLQGFLNEEKIKIIINILGCYYPNVNFELMKKHYSHKDLKIDCRENYYLQYNAGQTIDNLCKLIPKSGLLIIGVTVDDIYPRDEWNFVYGLANSMYGCAVFSLKRHIEEALEEYQTDDVNKIALYAIKNATKTMIHEIGHLFGIKHCIYYNCIMNGHNHSKEKSNPFFCPVCLRKIHYNLKFDIVKMYKSCLEYFINIETTNKNVPIDYNEEISWLKLRLESIE